MTTRNALSAAILNLISGMTFASPIGGVSTWVTVSNRLRLWTNVDADQQPAVFLVTHQETDEYRGLGLARRRLNYTMWCYCRSDNSPGSAMLDTMMDAFEVAFKVVDNPSEGSNTLGGLVYWCRIEGKIFKDPGDIDNQTLLIVPLVVEMP